MCIASRQPTDSPAESPTSFPGVVLILNPSQIPTVSPSEKLREDTNVIGSQGGSSSSNLMLTIVAVVVVVCVFLAVTGGWFLYKKKAKKSKEPSISLVQPIEFVSSDSSAHSLRNDALYNAAPSLHRVSPSRGSGEFIGWPNDLFQNSSSKPLAGVPGSDYGHFMRNITQVVADPIPAEFPETVDRVDDSISELTLGPQHLEAVQDTDFGQYFCDEVIPNDIETVIPDSVEDALRDV